MDADTTKKREIIPAWNCSTTDLCNCFYSFIDRSSNRDYLHTHNFIQIIISTKGTYVHNFNGREFTLGKGALIVVPPNFPHYIYTNDKTPTERYFWDISEEALYSISDDIGRDTLFDMIYLEPLLMSKNLATPYLYLSDDEVSEIVTLFEQMSKETLSGDKFSSMVVRGNGARIFAIIARRFCASATKERDLMFAEYRTAIKNALEFIDLHYSEKIRLDDVCAAATMSVRSFRYLFKRLVGSTYIEYLTNTRVRNACELLRTTNRTQYDISRSCGFAHTPYFQRTFIKVMGMLPGQYRASFR